MGGIRIEGDVGQVIHAELVLVNGNGPAPERISEAQSRLLKALVGRVNRARRGRPGHHDASTWQAVNRLAGVDHHRDMLKRDFDKAKDYLEAVLRDIDGGQSEDL